MQKNQIKEALELISLDGEVWKEIEGFEEYMVSSEGRVWSCKRFSLMSLSPNNKGFLKVNLTSGKSGRRRVCTKSVHQLVASAFLDNPKNYKFVKFIDGDKENCKAGNLAWCNKASTMQKDLKSYAVKNPLGKIVKFQNLGAFCKDNNLSKASMYHVLHGRIKVHRGWMLA